jgi:hypothetical protein
MIQRYRHRPSVVKAAGAQASQRRTPVILHMHMHLNATGDCGGNEFQMIN